MAQSVELLLDADAELAIRRQWDSLAAAGLPSEDRSGRPSAPGSQHHRPHLTLYAAPQLPDELDERLAAVVDRLELPVQIGSVLVFGPRRGRSILVRLVVPSAALLRIQSEVAAICGADPGGQFGPGRWSPHVTLARRVATEQVGAVLSVLGEEPVPARLTECRRWDGDAKVAWLL